MIEQATDEIMNAIKECIAHDTPMEDLKALIKGKLEDVREDGYESGYSSGFDNGADVYEVK